MLRELLERLSNSTTVTTKELAEHLGVTEDLVKLMLEDLERRGYLVSQTPQCSLQCESCPLRGSCVALSDDKLWLLRDRGHKHAS